MLLDIDYITENDKAVIRLFGKLKGDDEGKSFIVLDKSFEPYIYIIPHDEKQCIEDLNEFDINRIGWARKGYMGEIKDFIKLTLNHPQDVPKLRDKIRNLDSVKDILEHDIPFYRRYLIDKAIFPMAEVEVDGVCLDNKSVNFTCGSDVCIFEMNGNSRTN